MIKKEKRTKRKLTSADKKRHADAKKRKRLKDKITYEARSVHDKALARDLKLRGTRNAVVREADLRLRLAGKKIIEKLNWIVDEFTILDIDVRDVKNTEKNPCALNEVVLRSTTRGQLLKTQSSILFRKLNKLLPDIKSVEYTDVTVKPDKPENLSEAKLLDILKDNVPMTELVRLFPQFQKGLIMSKSLENLEIPEVAN